MPYIIIIVWRTIRFKFVVIGCSGAGKTVLLGVLTRTFSLKAASLPKILNFSHIPQSLMDVQSKWLEYAWSRAILQNHISIFKVLARSSLSFRCYWYGFYRLSRWLRDARIEADPHCPVVLVGNKSYLVANRLVSKEEDEKFPKTPINWNISIWQKHYHRDVFQDRRWSSPQSRN